MRARPGDDGGTSCGACTPAQTRVVRDDVMLRTIGCRLRHLLCDWLKLLIDAVLVLRAFLCPSFYIFIYLHDSYHHFRVKHIFKSKQLAFRRVDRFGEHFAS